MDDVRPVMLDFVNRCRDQYRSAERRIAVFVMPFVFGLLLGLCFVAVFATRAFGASLSWQIGAGVVAFFIGIALWGAAEESLEGWSDAKLDRPYCEKVSREFNKLFPSGSVQRKKALYVLHKDVSAERGGRGIMLLMRETQDEWNEVEGDWLETLEYPKSTSEPSS